MHPMSRSTPSLFNDVSRTDISTCVSWLCAALIFGTFLTAPAQACRDANTRPAHESQAPQSNWKQLEDPLLGFSLSYPADWSVEDQVISTQFTVDTKCRSVRMIDFAPPEGSGAAAPMEQSFVQVCTKIPDQADSLDQYMDRVYGESLQQLFVITDLNGTRAYRAKNQGPTHTIFARNRSGLIQIIATVAASRGKFEERQAQVEKILDSLTLL